MAKLTLRDLSLAGQKVLLRVDFNVPLKGGKITDDTRIRASIPSIQYILENGGIAILMSHLGKPQGIDPNLSLAPCAKRLSELLGKPVLMAPDCVGPEVEALVNHLKPGSILLLENLRFHAGEESPEKESDFTAKLARLGTLYVNDAFGTAHRAHASTTLLAHYFPGRAAAGFLMESEISHLSSLLQNPQHPFYAIIGGAKISTKIGVIQNLLKKVDRLYLGGGMTYTFMRAKGLAIGESIFEEAEIESAKKLLSESNNKILLPSDLVIAKGQENKTLQLNEGIPSGWQGVDIGPKTIREWTEQFKQAKMVFWNGPLGIFETPPFEKGTFSIATALSQIKAETIIGGGDSVAAIQQMGLSSCFAHLSTGGGASLEFLESGHLPGIDALSEKIS